MDLRPFAYERLSKDEIRLLKIVQIEPKIRISLERFPVSQVPEYACLSYCWGTETERRACECNGAVLYLTPHLSKGLRSIFGSYPSIRLWVDGICINQNDNVEKAEQVARMGNIYSEAEKVIVWLGPHHDDPEVMHVQPDAEAQQVIHSQKDLRHCPQIATRILDMYHRDWFTRLWVVQEVVLAKEFGFLVGNYSMPDLGFYLGHYIQAALSSPGNDPDSPKERGSASFLDNITRARTTKRLSGLHKPLAWRTIVEIARRQTASEPLDYAYALLGMLSKEVSAFITVDYSDEAKRNYGRAHAQLLKLLAPDLGEYIFDWHIPGFRPPGAPSWCGDLKWRGSGPEYDPSKKRGGLLNYVSAGMNSERNLHLQRADGPAICPRFESGSDTMLVRGVEADSILAIISPNRLRELGLPPEDLSKSEAVENFLIKYERARYWWKTGDEWAQYLLVGEQGPIKKLLHPFHPVLKRSGSNRVRLSFVALLTGLYGPPPSYTVRCYTLDVGRRWSGASVFITEGYRLGFGPSEILPGDKLCVFLGARLVYILRTISIIDTYEMIGDCFLMGMMEGQIFEHSELPDWRELRVV